MTRMADNRLEKLESARAELWQRMTELDYNRTRRHFMGHGGIMYEIRAERLCRLDRLIERLKQRGRRSARL